MLKKAMADRDKGNLNIIDISFNDLIKNRQKVVDTLSSKLDFPIISKKAKKEEAIIF